MDRFAGKSISFARPQHARTAAGRPIRPPRPPRPAADPSPRPLNANGPALKTPSRRIHRQPLTDVTRNVTDDSPTHRAQIRQDHDAAALRVLDLFSGVGAYSLGLERTGGFRTVAFCEIEEYPRKILRKHWPDVPIFEDVRALNADALARAGIDVDVIVAGWPCQDISPAGTGSGLDGSRSGLWAEISRLAGELRPNLLVLENSSNLLAINDGRDFGRVLGDLAALGFDAEWHCLPAAAFDAPHYRDRLWIVAHAQSQRWGKGNTDACGSRAGVCPREERGSRDDRGALANADSFAPVGSAIAREKRHSWLPEPGMDRVVAGCPNRVDRIRAIGNLNPPIIPETIGRAILEARRAA